MTEKQRTSQRKTAQKAPTTVDQLLRVGITEAESDKKKKGLIADQLLSKRIQQEALRGVIRKAKGQI